MTKCTVRKVKGKSVMNFCNYCKRPLQNSYFQLLFRHHFANDIYFNIKKQVISSHVIFRQTAHSYFLEELLPCSNCVPFLSSLCSKKKLFPFKKTRVHVIAVSGWKLIRNSWESRRLFWNTGRAGPVPIDSAGRPGQDLSGFHHVGSS